MPTELDQQLKQIMAGLTAPGGMFETVPFEAFGTTVPALKNAPPSLAHYLGHFCQQHKDVPFMVDGEVRLTFGEAYAAARAVATGLVARHGVAKGDRVGIAARNSANWAVAYMGVLLAGGCATLLNGFWSGEELAEGIDLAECALVLVDEAREKRLEGRAHRARLLRFEHGVPPQEGFASLWPDAGEAELPQLGPDDLATILFTSGSTGQSKGAYSNHRGVVHGTMSYVAQTVMSLHALTMRGMAPPAGQQPCALVAVPLFHVTGEVPLFLQSFAIGRKLVFMPRWDAREAMRLMEAEKVTYFVGVPLMSYEIATHPERDRFDLSACKSFAAGGAPRPVDHVTKIKDAFPEGFPLLGYGLTETNAVGCGNFNENYMAKPGSTGRASEPLVDLAILDDEGRPVPQGERGEVCIRSVANFLGYWKNEEATRAAFTADGYFRTGDLGYLDEDEYLFIVDRKKDIIIRGGENIACPEVEQAIYAHPDVAECSVFGLADDRYGEICAAVYYPRDGATLTPDELKAFLGEHIAAFKIPERLWRADAPLPRLGTEKIDKVTLRRTYAQEVEAA
ncbi:AMP-dependent synthetase [Erythrobacteraceae bacterium CFH 75059]|uniref:class I adenylate-forming enzyme family protein n=1 Tax=Qipengyuania thermophila TaxID=2509361 RepID=UPI001020CB4E|nr:class I adenylate-forming enzyme family protein [Qipengyuania thermophila]TCD06511.1 AMP-dependent synthetase [Erythrobacteraceae bacterium CFH 75059]